jgi:putative nucleotidyltransferase with HDIG domain
VRNRGRIVLVSGVAAVAVLLVGLAAGLFQDQPLGWVFWNCALVAAGSVLAAGFLVEGLLPLIERAFGVSTAMTLLEWCDASKPLLRMLAGEAPGTYNHSLMVGALAESAADAIGANGLLCRAGAYYHDIGKIRKPEYFVENQQFGVSRHHKLAPAMSHLVIINHVKDGIEMAREYRIPQALHAFIAEHHGTCVVEYFYHAAARARKPDAPEVTEQEFRYPGPKPQSRETAILMICDAVEGAVRAMSEPARIEEVVTRISEKRLLDGQFDECDLTFKELALVQKAVVKTLNGIYHARIVYPEDEREGAEDTATSTRVQVDSATGTTGPTPPSGGTNREKSGTFNR